jgi:hypothetical protein
MMRFSFPRLFLYSAVAMGVLGTVVLANNLEQAGPETPELQANVAKEVERDETTKAVPSEAHVALERIEHANAERAAGDPEHDPGADLFAPKSWYTPPPPPPIVKAAAPAKPSAPPIPYTYLGQIEDDGGTTIFLALNGDLIATRQGEALDQKYRLEKVSQQQLIFVYLPLNERQTLNIADQ